MKVPLDGNNQTMTTLSSGQEPEGGWLEEGISQGPATLVGTMTGKSGIDIRLPEGPAVLSLDSFISSVFEGFTSEGSISGQFKWYRAGQAFRVEWFPPKEGTALSSEIAITDVSPVYLSNLEGSIYADDFAEKVSTPDSVTLKKHKALLVLPNGEEFTLPVLHLQGVGLREAPQYYPGRTIWERVKVALSYVFYGPSGVVSTQDQLRRTAEYCQRSGEFELLLIPGSSYTPRR